MLCRFNTEFTGSNEVDDTAGRRTMQKNIFGSHEALFVQVRCTVPATCLQSIAQRVIESSHGAVNACHAGSESYSVALPQSYKHDWQLLFVSFSWRNSKSSYSGDGGWWRRGWRMWCRNRKRSASSATLRSGITSTTGRGRWWDRQHCLWCCKDVCVWHCSSAKLPLLQLEHGCYTECVVVVQ